MSLYFPRKTRFIPPFLLSVQDYYYTVDFVTFYVKQESFHTVLTVNVIRSLLHINNESTENIFH